MRRLRRQREPPFVERESGKGGGGGGGRVDDGGCEKRWDADVRNGRIKKGDRLSFKSLPFALPGT